VPALPRQPQKKKSIAIGQGARSPWAMGASYAAGASAAEAQTAALCPFYVNTFKCHAVWQRTLESGAQGLV